ncbi:GNAT family N-acetyltransferase [Microbacterium ulmi]|uniref:GNAT family N-acetyltransferase n=1 Tax=Microbacterium ulmi TaxID=179095 RepID=A0A7Y2PYK6_9MICO|nr:GNAT family protein [Microbacterium ulmi]NII69651.1 RimJ/RimL family protein N-acetyltransferase [Microbacterium ulmi]NNH03461.1 GNAT family N-acetyltransferase [Microbacterium ulmi]
MSSPELVRVWPAAGLRARAGDLELRWIDDDLLLALADVAARGIHDDDRMPFYVPWTRGTPEQVARSVVSYQWGVRPLMGPGRLRIELGVLVDGVPVGVQGAGGDEWPVLHRVETGSWLGRDFQGQGTGTRMRALMLELLFAGLGADEVTSGAFVDNPASAAVSRKVGYLDNGMTTLGREGRAVAHRNFLMTRDRWLAVRSANLALLDSPVELEGVEAVRAVLDPE